MKNFAKIMFLNLLTLSLAACSKPESLLITDVDAKPASQSVPKKPAPDSGLVSGMPAPGHEGTPEMVVEEPKDDDEEAGNVTSAVPAPGHEGTPEMIVEEPKEGEKEEEESGSISSAMPAPGHEGTPEMIVASPEAEK